jgi:hypothetical protein
VGASPEKVDAQRLHRAQLTARSNGLAETKNGAIVRKLFGYEHIPQRHATRFNTFCREYLNPFLNFHRPCLFATPTSLIRTSPGASGGCTVPATR